MRLREERAVVLDALVRNLNQGAMNDTGQAHQDAAATARRRAGSSVGRLSVVAIAFVINLQGHVLVRMLERGMFLYVANAPAHVPPGSAKRGKEVT